MEMEKMNSFATKMGIALHESLRMRIKNPFLYISRQVVRCRGIGSYFLFLFIVRSRGFSAMSRPNTHATEPRKLFPVPDMTYDVFGETLNLAQLYP